MTISKQAYSARIDEIDTDTSMSPAAKTKAYNDLAAEMKASQAPKHIGGIPTSAFASAPGSEYYDGGQAQTHAKGISQFSPLTFSGDDFASLHNAASHRGSHMISAKSASDIQSKAFSTASPLLPAGLSPTVIGREHEDRFADRLPAMQISTPVYEYLRHSATVGGPGITLEGDVKPSTQATLDTMVATVRKVATYSTISWESIRDYPAFSDYWTAEVIRQVIDVETAQLLHGDGTGNNLTGLSATPGILSHAIDTAGGEKAIDAIEASIAQLRVGSALATASLVVMNPSDWSLIRRSKDTQGRYLLTDIATAPEANRIFGIEVLTTTAQPAGSAIMLDTSKAATVLVRDALSVQTGTNADDFSRNLQTFVVEQRIALAVHRPSAILEITGIA